MITVIAAATDDVGVTSVQFTVDGTQKEHDALMQRLRQAPELNRIECLGMAEHE